MTISCRPATVCMFRVPFDHEWEVFNGIEPIVGYVVLSEVQFREALYPMLYMITLVVDGIAYLRLQWCYHFLL